MSDDEATPADVLAIIEDHTPRIHSWIDGSTWLTCDCGWDQSEPKAPDWHTHLVAAVENGLI